MAQPRLASEAVRDSIFSFYDYNVVYRIKATYQRVMSPDELLELCVPVEDHEFYRRLPHEFGMFNCSASVQIPIAQDMHIGQQTIPVNASLVPFPLPRSLTDGSISVYHPAYDILAEIAANTYTIQADLNATRQLLSTLLRTYPLPRLMAMSTGMGALLGAVMERENDYAQKPVTWWYDAYKHASRRMPDLSGAMLTSLKALDHIMATFTLLGDTKTVPSGHFCFG